MVTVIIPVYNSKEFLQQSIESILAQSCVSEIILVEDGSSDNSLQLCFKLAKKNSKIKVLSHINGQNRGAAESRNLGIQNASNLYIAFLDSDDVYFDNRFTESLNILDQNSEVDGCYGKVLVNYVEQNRQKLMGPPSSLSSKQLMSFLLNGGYFHTNSITVRKSFLEKVGNFNQICWPHEDVELWIRMAYKGNLVSITSDVPLAEYKIHGNNLSKISNSKTRFLLWKIVFLKFFFKDIDWCDRIYILKQLAKVLISKIKQV